MKNETYKQGGGQAWFLWTLVGVVFVNWLFLFQTSYSIFNEGMAEDIGLTLAQVGTIGAIYTWVFATAQFFSGALLDRLGARTLIPGAIGVMVAGAFVLAYADTYSEVLISQVLMGIGASYGFCGGGFIGGKWFGMAKFGFMFGLVQMSASLGSYFGVEAIVDLLFVQGMSWNTLALYGAWVGLGIFIVAAIFMRDPEPVAKPENGVTGVLKDTGKSLVHVIKNKQVALHAIVGGTLFGVLLGMAVIWFPKLLVAQGFESTEAGSLSALTWIGLAFGAPVFNMISDKIKRRHELIVIGTIAQFAALAYVAFAAEPSYAAIAAAIITFGFMNGAHMLNFSGAADNVEPQYIGTSAAVVNGIMFIIGGLLMALPGNLLTDLSLANWQYALLPFWISGIIATGLSFMIKESYPGRDEKPKIEKGKKLSPAAA